jgi:hypothetical protein
VALSNIDGFDAPACPFLGLAADRRTHFTYPHPGHRCFAAGGPATTDAQRQAAYCLSPQFITCERYRASESSQDRSQAASRQTVAQPTPGSSMAAGRPPVETKVIYVFRTGDSLAKIAARYALSADQIAEANGLNVDAALADGTRLLIPLDMSAASIRGLDQRRRRQNR